MVVSYNAVKNNKTLTMFIGEDKDEHEDSKD